MNVLLTGAAGFLGSHFADRLLADGHAVLGVDNLSTGRLENLAHLREGDGWRDSFDLLQADASEPLTLPDGYAPQAVVHMASPASPVDFSSLGLEIMRVNAEGTRHLLELAARCGARFVFTSTSEVYGDPHQHPQAEDYRGNVNPVGPRAVYDESKRYAEALTMAGRQRLDVDTGIVRVFNTYGPRMRADDGRVLPAFIRAGLRGEPLPMHGDGSQTRSFNYVDDTVDGVARMLASDFPGPVNIGNPDEITIRQLADEVIAATGGQSRVESRPAQPDDPRRRCPDIALAERELGWRPTVGRTEGLRRTVAFFEQTNF